MTIRLTAWQRDALKSALRNHPDIKASGLRIIGQKDEMLALAAKYGVAIPQAPTASDVFDDVDTDTDTGVDTDAAAALSKGATEQVAEQAEDADALVQSILTPLGKGDFEGFKSSLAALAIRATTPIVKEVPAPAPVTCKGHVPKRKGQTTAKAALGIGGTFASLPLALWDAPDAPRVDDDYVWPAPTGAILSQLRRGRNVFLTGPAGTGKTTFAEQLAARTGRPFAFVSCTEQTDAATLVGMTVPNAGGVTWQDGQLTAAIRRPGTVILIDEPSVARPGALFVLQAVLDGRRALAIEETGELVPVADGVCFILADNTSGTGDETGAYEGTRRLNRATLDRCGITAVIDYLPADDETRVLSRRAGCTLALAGIAVAYAAQTRAAVTKGSLTHGVGIRRLVAWCELVTDGVDPAEAFDLAIHTTAAPDDREVLRQLFRAHVSVDAVRSARK